MARIKLEAISADAFAPFGQLLVSPAFREGRLDLIDELQDLRGAAKTRLSLAAATPTALPLTVKELERHEFSSQAFMPYGGTFYLALVAPSDAVGRPDAAGLRAFRVPADIGVNYAAGTWHYRLTALDSPARFVMLTFVDGTAADEEFAALAEPVVVER